MDLTQIEVLLDSPNPQSRMKAITELRNHDPAAAVPLLKRQINDKEFLIRSFAAMGLGHKRTDEGFSALLEILENEADNNVVAEAANSLAKFGASSIPHLVKLFEQNQHWLVRQSVLATSEDFEDSAVLLKLCRLGFNGAEATVKQLAIAYLSQLAATPQAPNALEILIRAAADEDPQIRAIAARVLRQFDDEQAQAAIAKLRQDSHHQVVGAVLEGLLD